MAQAAVTPKKRLSGTVTAAVISVSLMDDRVSGSRRAVQVDREPFLEGLAENRRQRQQQEQRQKDQGNGDQQPAHQAGSVWARPVVLCDVCGCLDRSRTSVTSDQLCLYYSAYLCSTSAAG